MEEIFELYPDILPGADDIIDLFQDEPETLIGIGIEIGITIIDNGLDDTIGLLEDLGIDTSVESPGFEIIEGEDIFGGDFDLDLSGTLDMLSDTIELDLSYDYHIDIGDLNVDISLDIGYDWNYIDDTFVPDDDTLIDINIIITR